MLESMTDRALIPAAAPDAAELPAPWRIECTRWTPSRGDGDRLGIADLTIDGRIVLRAVRIVRHRDGGLMALSPCTFTRADRAPPAAWLILGAAGQRGFDVAAAAAIERFAPPQEAPQPPHAARLPDAHPIPETPPRAAVAPATMEICQ